MNLHQPLRYSRLKLGPCTPVPAHPCFLWHAFFLLMVIAMPNLVSCQARTTYPVAIQATQPSSATPEAPSSTIQTSPVMPTEKTPTPTELKRGAFYQASFFSPILGYDFEYQIYLPAGYEGGNLRYPVIYLLHGRGDTMYGWQYIQTDLDRMIAEGQIPPIIAVLPDVPASKRASYFVDSSYALAPIQGEAVETAILNDFIPHIDQAYRTIPRREGRAIGGYSMGGYGAVRYPLAHPEVFSAAIILSPAVYVPLPPDDSSARLFGAFGEGDQVFVESIYTSKNYPALLPEFEKAKLPLYAYLAVGDDEWRNPQVENYAHDLDFETARLYNALAHTRYVVAQSRVLDGGHDWDVWQPAFIEGLTWISKFLEKAN